MVPSNQGTFCGENSPLWCSLLHSALRTKKASLQSVILCLQHLLKSFLATERLTERCSEYLIVCLACLIFLMVGKNGITSKHIFWIMIYILVGRKKNKSPRWFKVTFSFFGLRSPTILLKDHVFTHHPKKVTSRICQDLQQIHKSIGSQWDLRHVAGYFIGSFALTLLGTNPPVSLD